jgi:hypothetical protein
MEGQLSAQFETMGIPADAREWLLDLWRVIQVIDDATDGDTIPRAAASQATWAIFVRMPLNPFYQFYMGSLQPVLVMQLIKWEAANKAEAEGLADERSFMWRAGYYEVVAMACHLAGCNPMPALQMYGETFADYRGEFPCQTL